MLVTTDDRRTGDGGRPRRRIPAGAAVLAPILVVMATKLFALNDPLLFDDYFLLHRVDPRISSLGAVLASGYILAEPGLYNGWQGWWSTDSVKMKYFRPIPALLLRLEFMLWGANAAGYHLDSLLAYLLCTCLLFLAALRLYGGCAALIAGMVFAASPLHYT
ncbi:hypothetical protein JW905_11645, partial [bacterium]|nr:hypothetical protein [candidate division CSSED10-310 bacterium]